MPSGREATAVDPSRAFGYGCSASLVELEANMKLPQRAVTVTLGLLAPPPVAAVAAGAYRPRIEEPR